MSTNHRILGMECNVAYGISFILPFMAIVFLICDHGLSRENKQFMYEALIGWAAAFILGAITFFIGNALAYVVHAVMIFIGILNLLGGVTHLPFADKLAAMLAK